METRSRDYWLDHAQIGDEPTPYGRYMRACQCLLSRYDSLVGVHLRLREYDEELEAAAPGTAKRQRLEWERAKTERKVSALRREFDRFFAIAEYLERELGGAVMTSKRKRDLEAELYKARVERNAAHAILAAAASGRPPNLSGPMAGAMRFPVEEREEFFRRIATKGLEWAIERLREPAGGEALERIESKYGAAEAALESSVVPMLEVASIREDPEGE